MKLNQAIKILTAIVGAAAMEQARKDIVNQTIFLPKATGNAKLGFETSTYSPRTTCPKGCPFKACGACYAEQGKCKMWFGVAGGALFQGKKLDILVSELKTRLQNQAATHMIRHNTSGDLCTNNSAYINPALVATLIDAYEGHKAYTYTHAPITGEVGKQNLQIIAAACKAGFTINKSCENIEQVKIALAAGVPAALAVDKMPEKKATIEGINFYRCPAAPYKFDEKGKPIPTGVTCAQCKKCANCKRKCVVVFPVHGPAANNARKAGFLIPELSEKALNK